METVRRTVVKAVGWRIVSFALTATAITLYTHGKIRDALIIAGILQTLKFFGYIWYERAWNKNCWGRELPEAQELQGSPADEAGLPRVPGAPQARPAETAQQETLPFDRLA